MLIENSGKTYEIFKNKKKYMQINWNGYNYKQQKKKSNTNFRIWCTSQLNARSRIIENKFGVCFFYF